MPTSLLDAFAATRALPDAADPRVKTLIDVMDAASRALLMEWQRGDLRREVGEFDATHRLDTLLTGLILGFLWARPETCGDAVRGEELGRWRDPRAVTATHVWLMDAIDGTDAFLRGDASFGTSLLVWERATGVVVGNLFVLPAQGTVYFSTGTVAWRNGIPVRPPSLAVRSSPRTVVLRRPRRGLSPDVEQHYRRVEDEIRRRDDILVEGQPCTALDILSLAEGGPPSTFLYHAKLWDLLSAASVAHAAGVPVTFYPSGERVFPLSDTLFERAHGDRVLVLIERP